MEYQESNVEEIVQGAIFFFEVVLTKTFLFNTFFIFKISNPPYLSIVGLSKRLTIVDSRPILHFPHLRHI
jgi:hypothetical protein